MSDIQRHNDEIRHLETIQRKTLSKSARFQVVQKLARTVADKNRAVSAAHHAEAVRQSRDHSEELAKEAFTRHGRGRIFA